MQPQEAILTNGDGDADFGTSESHLCSRKKQHLIIQTQIVEDSPSSWIILLTAGKDILALVCHPGTISEHDLVVDGFKVEVAHTAETLAHLVALSPHQPLVLVDRVIQLKLN